MENFKSLLKHIRAFVFDVDGVLTNGQLLVMPDGELLRSMNIKDGYALQLAVKKGFFVVIISGGKSEGVPKRLQKLGVTDVFMNVEDKVHTLNQYTLKHRIPTNEILYMGDDVPDLKVMKLCGIASCPADAVSEVKENCIYVSQACGGEGAVRDVIEQTLRVQGKWE